MPTQVLWENAEKNIIRQVFIDPWTIDDWVAVMREAYTMIDSVEYEVDVIIDGTDVKRIPANTLARLNGINNSVHPRQRFLVAIATNMFAKSMFDLIRKIRPKLVENTKLVSTVDEAVEEIQRMRENGN